MAEQGRGPIRAGNLFEPVPGEAAIDGRFSTRTRTTRQEFWTSRDRDLLLTGFAGAAILGLAGMVALASAPRRLRGRQHGRPVIREPSHRR